MCAPTGHIPSDYVGVPVPGTISSFSHVMKLRSDVLYKFKIRKKKLRTEKGKKEKKKCCVWWGGAGRGWGDSLVAFPRNTMSDSVSRAVPRDSFQAACVLHSTLFPSTYGPPKESDQDYKLLARICYHHYHHHFISKGID